MLITVLIIVPCVHASNTIDHMYVQIIMLIKKTIERRILPCTSKGTLGL